MTGRDSLRLDWLHGEVAELRARYEESCCVADRGEVSWTDIVRGGDRLALMVQQPRRRRSLRHAIVYVHGGGWIVGSPRTHADISRALCEETGMTVVSVDYRLAPEHPAPAPVDDVCLTLSAVLAPDGSLGRFDGVFLCGDSAGASIALAVEARSEAPLRHRIDGVCAFYGAFGLADSASMRQFGSAADGLDAACVARMWRLGHGPCGASPYTIDALAGPSGAPVYLLAAGRDPLRDDTLALAAAYAARGRRHRLDVVETAGHGFLHGAGAADTIGRVAAWMRSSLSGAA